MRSPIFKNDFVTLTLGSPKLYLEDHAHPVVDVVDHLVVLSNYHLGAKVSL